MKIKSQRDFWSGLMFVAVGIGFAWGATTYSFGSSARPGPGYFPFGLGILLAVLGSIVLFKALTIEVEGGDLIGDWRLEAAGLHRRHRHGVRLDLAASGHGGRAADPGLHWRRVAGDEFHLKEALVNAVVLTVFSWFMFIKGLSLTIPLWPSFLAG